MTVISESPFAEEYLSDEFERGFDAFSTASADEGFSDEDQVYVDEWSEPEDALGYGADESWSPQAFFGTELNYERQLAPADDGYDETSTAADQEIVLGTMRTKSIRMPAADPPCMPDSPVSPVSSSRTATDSARVPNWQPGSGRVRRRASAPYVRWVQHSLNTVLGTSLAVDGVWGPHTSRALREFQRRAVIGVDGRIGPETEGALRRWTRTEPPEREAVFEGIAPAVAIAGAGVAIAGAGLALNLVKFGFDTIAKIASGDLQFHAPRQAVGIRGTNVPNHFLLRPKQRSFLITNFIEKSPVGVEQVNVKLRCKVMYDGINLDARFSFDPQGQRSRLRRDTVIRIGDPMALERGRAPVEWQRCGVPDYGILRIPISFRIDRPWPLDNYNENFELVLSSMYGFGATASGPGRAHIQGQRVAWN